MELDKGKRIFLYPYTGLWKYFSFFGLGVVDMGSDHLSLHISLNGKIMLVIMRYQSPNKKQ